MLDDISNELAIELNHLDSILKGKISFTKEERGASQFKYLSDKDFHAAKFLEGAHNLFSKTKNDDRTYNKAYYWLMKISGENDYPYLNSDIANIKDYVLRSDLPEDNLWRSYDLPQRKATRPHKKEDNNIAGAWGAAFNKACSTFIGWDYKWGLGIILTAIALFFTYAVDHEKIDAYVKDCWALWHSK